MPRPCAAAYPGGVLKKIYVAAFAYAIAGLLSGLAYREYTKLRDFTGERTQLSFMHTHLFALGMLVMLIVLVLERLFELSAQRTFRWFFWVYNAGLVLTVVMLGVRGVLVVEGYTEDETTKAIPGFAGLGHMMLAAGLTLLFLALGKSLKRSADLPDAAAEPATLSTR